MTSTTLNTPAANQRCAGHTRSGRPCKLRPNDSETPFCHNHIPRGVAEFVGGGPLDGLAFWQRWGSPSPSSIMGIDRSRKGKVVLCELGGTQDPKLYSIGVYRFQYNGLVPEWRWEPNTDA